MATIKAYEKYKSINEKAEEYSFIGQGIGPSGIQYRDFNINKKDAFIAGSNYVLDVVEEFMEHNLVYSGNLKRLIEQLKK